jgi:hypothetical protein
MKQADSLVNGICWGFTGLVVYDIDSKLGMLFWLQSLCSIFPFPCLLIVSLTARMDFRVNTDAYACFSKTIVRLLYS